MAIGIKAFIEDNGRIREHFYHIKKEKKMNNTEFDKDGNEIVDMDNQIEPIVVDAGDSEPDATTGVTDSEPIIEEVEGDDDDDDLDDDDENEDDTTESSDVTESVPVEPIDLK